MSYTPGPRPLPALGTAAAHDVTDFDSAGAAAAAQSAAQGSSAQTANNLSDLASAPAARAHVGAEPLLLPVAVGCYGHQSNTSNATTGTGEAPYYIATACSDVVLLYQNWYSNNSQVDTDNTAALAVNASLKVGGAEYQAKFAGKTTAAPDPGGFILSDRIPLDVATPGVQYVRTYTGGSAWHSPHAAIAAGEGGFTSTTDLTAPGSGTITEATSFTAIPGPNAILGVPVGHAKGVYAVGDSITWGTNDGSGSAAGYNTVTTQLGSGGWLGRACIAAGVGLLNVAVPSDTAQNFAAFASRYRRLTLAKYSSTIVCGYGRNDLSAGRTLAQIQADLITIWTLLAHRAKSGLYQPTITPKSTSTDGWLTTANQTPSADNPTRINLNDWMRDGAPMSGGAAVAAGTAGASRCAVHDATGTLVTAPSGPAHLITGILEVADTVESARNSGKWYVPANIRAVGDGAANTGTASVATSATINFATPADLGRTLLLAGAAAAGALYIGSVNARNSTSSVNLSTPISTTVSAATLTLTDGNTLDGTHPVWDGHRRMAAAFPSTLIK